MTASPQVLWRLTDGKPGHDSQTRGLAYALVRRAAAHGISLTVHDVRVPRGFSVWWAGLRRQFPWSAGLPAPQWIVCAGSGTHAAGWAARRAVSGRLICLMTPSLPLRLFDAVIAPHHDGVSGPNVFTTQGALNPMQPGVKVPGSVLVLIGGPSPHVTWSDAQIQTQLAQVLVAHPDACLTDSRRTPTTLKVWLAQQGLNYHPAEQTPPGWLAVQLAETETVFVTADSVSMLYESLTAGCKTHLLWPGEPNPKSRVMQALEPLPAPGLAEADRVATWLWARFL